MTSNHNQQFTVHQLWPEEGTPVDYDPLLTVIFFHGLKIRDGEKAWKTTWSQRQMMSGGNCKFKGHGVERMICWPQEWLPRDLGERTVAVYSLSYDADTFQWKGRGRTEDVQEIGKNLIQELVVGSKWRMDQMRTIALVGYSFGGLVLKSLRVEAKKQATLPEGALRNELTRRTSNSCKDFLEKVKCAVFYSTPHSGSDAAALAQNLRELSHLPVTLSGILKNLEPFERSMEELSVAFVDAALEDINIYAFGEGGPISFCCGLKSVLVVPYASAMRLSSNNNMKIEDANQYQVCKPTYPTHISYTKLLELLRLVMTQDDVLT